MLECVPERESVSKRVCLSECLKKECVCVCLDLHSRWPKSDFEGRQTKPDLRMPILKFGPSVNEYLKLNK